VPEAAVIGNDLSVRFSGQRFPDGFRVYASLGWIGERRLYRSVCGIYKRIGTHQFVGPDQVSFPCFPHARALIHDVIDVVRSQLEGHDHFHFALMEKGLGDKGVWIVVAGRVWLEIRYTDPLCILDLFYQPSKVGIRVFSREQVGPVIGFMGNAVKTESVRIDQEQIVIVVFGDVFCEEILVFALKYRCNDFFKARGVYDGPIDSRNIERRIHDNLHFPRTAHFQTFACVSGKGLFNEYTGFFLSDSAAFDNPVAAMAGFAVEFSHQVCFGGLSKTGTLLHDAIDIFHGQL